MPGFVDPHIHLDKALIVESVRPNVSGTLTEAIEIIWERKRRYSVDDHVHIHLVCDKCGKVESIDAAIADPFLDELRTRPGFVTDVSHIALHGSCSGCSTARG